ncbi:PAS domain S-box protein [bacterium]|nr:PAS domain S-box protein [bacterium]
MKKRPIRVLYIDDNRHDRELVRDILQKESGDFEILEAESREEFEVRLADQRYDLILSDFNILGFEGLDVLETVKAQCKDIPVIILTGSGSEEVAVEALKRGAADYVTKTPRQIRRLPQSVQSVLTKKQLRLERLRAKKALRQSEARSRRILEASIGGMYIYDIEESRHIYINPQYTALTGYMLKHLNAMTPAEFFELYHPDDQSQIEAHRRYVCEALPDGQNAQIDYRFRTASGDWAWYTSCSAVYERDKTGKARRCIGTFIDVTERKQAGEKLAKSYAWQEAIIEGSRDGIFVSDADSRFVIVNRAACELTGYTREELLEMHIPDLHEAPDLDVYRNYHSRIMAGDEITSEAKILRKDGVKVVTEFSNRQITIAGNSYMHSVARDITKRKRAAEALRESEEQFRQLAENVDAVFWMRSGDGAKQLYVSPKFESIWGLSLEILRKNPDCFMDLVHPTDLPALKAAFSGLAAGGRPENYNLEYRIVRPDGELRWIHDQGFAICNDRGELIRQAGFAEDITERKRAEEALFESEAMLQRAQAISHVGTWKLDPSTNSVKWSDEMYRLFAIKPEDFDGSLDTAKKRIHPDDLEHAVSLSKAAINTKTPYELEYRIVHPDGTEIHAVTKGEVICDESGDVLEVIGTVQDITERKAAEKKLKRWARFFKYAHWGIATSEDRKTLHMINPAFAKMHGYCIEELEGKPIAQVFAPEVRTEVLKQIRTAYKKGHHIFETKHLRKDGTVFPVEIDITAINGKDGKPRFHVANVHDITQRKLAEEEVARSREALQNLTTHLQSVREKERKHIAREIHDEFGQVLTILHIDLAWISARLTEDQQHLMNKIKLMGKLVDSTIDRVRQIARDLRPGLLDDLGLVAAIDWQAQEFQKKTDIKCDLDLPDQEFDLSQTMATNLFRILQEALTNVVRHAQATKVHIKLTKEKDDLVLEIKDNGCGIRKEQSLDSNSIGIIGMRERVNVIKGSFRIDGAPKKGTRMSVSVPLKRMNEPTNNNPKLADNCFQYGRLGVF